MSKNPKDLPAAQEMCDRVETIMGRYTGYLFIQDKGLHKQHANRVLETYAFHTVIVTASHWRNFFGLRASKMAQPEAQDFTLAMAKAMMASTPKELSAGEWHLPYLQPEDLEEGVSALDLAYASAGKCARTSYLTQDGRRALDEDVRLAKSLMSNGHMSPFQHPARPREHGDPHWSHGNYSPVWTQLRKLITNEHDFSTLINHEDLLIGCRGDEAMANFILSLPE